MKISETIALLESMRFDLETQIKKANQEIRDHDYKLQAVEKALYTMQDLDKQEENNANRTTRIHKSRV